MKKQIVQLGIAAMIFLPNFALAEEITVTVKGMVCSFCAQGIKKTFGKKESVKDINVDLDKKIVKLNVKDGSKMKDEEITQTINDAGYDVVNIVRRNND